MKISHSANPRNRSIRNSRSNEGRETGGIKTCAGAGPARSSPPASADDGAATRSTVVTRLAPRTERKDQLARSRPSAIIQAWAQFANDTRPAGHPDRQGFYGIQGQTGRARRRNIRGGREGDGAAAQQIICRLFAIRYALSLEHPCAGTHETTRVHHIHRRRGCVTAGSACVATGEDEADRDSSSIRIGRQLG